MNKKFTKNLIFFILGIVFTFSVFSQSVFASTYTNTTTSNNISYGQDIMPIKYVDYEKSSNRNTIIDTKKFSKTSDGHIRPAVDMTGVSDTRIAALSFKGSGGFMPSSVWQWILVSVFILVIIILLRTVNNSFSKTNSHR